MLCNIHNLIYVDEQTDFTALQDIPAMQRRRLSALAKMVLHTAKATLQDTSVDYIVWSSCYGDEKTTFNIMHDIANGDTPSPTQFSTSVHNAISGLYSILFQDDTPATSLSSAMHQSWQDAILEAYTYLKQNQQKKALIVYYDAPLPEIYTLSDELHHAISIDKMYAIGAILSLDFAQDCANLSMYPQDGVQESYLPQAQVFYDFWYSKQSKLSSSTWVFEKCSD